MLWLRRGSRLRPLTGAVLAVTALAAVGWQLRDALREDPIIEIEPGRVYQSGEMEPARLAEVVRELGLRSVVDLRLEDEGLGVAGEREALAELGVTHFHLPTSQVPPEKDVAAFLDFVSDPENLPTLVHCEHGSGRSVLFSALYRIEHLGWSNEAARRATRAPDELDESSFALDRGKGRYLGGYERRLAGVGGAAR